MYSRRLGGRILDLEPAGRQLVDRKTRSRFSLVTGREVTGPLEGTTRMPATTSYWFA